MSTLMSTDMNITRPTSRVIRAPGGGSSITFGDAAPAAPAKKVEAAPAPVVVTPVAEAEAAPKVVVSGKVGVVVAGNVASDVLRDAVVKALVIEGITGTVVSSVAEVAVLPYAAQNLAKSVDIVIAAAFVINDANGAVSQSLNSALLNVGVNGGKPIVPALIAQSSLLEAKAVLPDHATSWAKAAAAVLGLGEVEATLAVVPEIKVVPTLTPAVLDANDLLDIFRESLKSHGASGIIGIGRKFRIADDNNSGTVDLAEFTKVVHEHALKWSNAQIKALFDNFDKDKSGSISFDEFIQGLRGDLNDRRKQLVLMAFEILDADKSGVIELNDIKAKYNAKKHPDVISGKTTEDAILREFLNTFDQGEKDGKVTPAEFIQYYGNVSSSIDNDDYFELMIRNAWHISGGEGWCANTSCRRVLVTHKDGRQTVEEIKNDLGISGDDMEAIIAKLVEQGIDDIETVELAGGKKSKVEVPNEAPKAAVTSANVAAGTKPLGAGGEHINRPPTASSVNNPRRQPGGASSLVLG